ncbi:MAG TPA: response regulator transcription factor [Kofleriaceae bacterium]|nr:response regulator transcription factor [Kofleriaceae bacterium]
MHVLVDVSNDRLCREIVEVLARAGHSIERGVPARTSVFDLALVGTPEAAAKLRQILPAAAIIVVTKVGDVPARVRALEVGADDAFDGSFPPAQIMARVGAVGRRAAMTPRPVERLAIDGCTIDLAAAVATRDPMQAPIALTAREVEIVRWLAQHAGHVVSRAELLQHVWRVSAGTTTRAVDVAIVALRAKLERDPASPVIIVSVRGVGYRWGSLTNG